MIFEQEKIYINNYQYNLFCKNNKQTIFTKNKKNQMNYVKYFSSRIKLIDLLFFNKFYIL